MSDACYCDYEPATIYNAREVIARKAHRCSECSREIKPGESYEYVFAVWDGAADSFKTCSHCLAIRAWVKAHVPCFCWGHGGMRDEAKETAANYACDAPGFWVGWARREILARRALSASFTRRAAC